MLPKDEIRISATHLKNKIKALHNDVHRRNRDTLAATDATEGEHIGKTWSNRHKENKPQDTIKCLKFPNTDSQMRISREMAKIVACYHEQIQHNGHNPRDQLNGNTLEEILQHVKRKTSEDSKNLLSAQITEEEVQEAI